MVNFKHNKTKSFFFYLCVLIFFLGAPNYWFKEFKVAKIVKSIHYYVHKIIIVIMCFLIFWEWSGLLNQNKLNEKQKTDLFLFSVGHPIVFTYVISSDFIFIVEIKEMLFNLTEKMKAIFNDEEVEREMIKRAKFFTRLYIGLLSMALLFYGIAGMIQVFLADGTFVTVVTGWPDVDDHSTIASIARVIAYVLWWMFMLRVSTVFAFVISVTVCLSYQYKHLCSYFLSLNGIFERDESQEEKDQKFVEAFKIGIDMHSDTLWCTRSHQKVFSKIFGGQILTNVTLLILLMSQLVTAERTIGTALVTLTTASSVLISTGCLMWTAGDVAIEASHLPTAMFESGWQNCRRETTTRVRSLVLIAIWWSQRPLHLKCLGVVNLSYESFLSILFSYCCITAYRIVFCFIVRTAKNFGICGLKIVKSSYSVFSVLYAE